MEDIKKTEFGESFDNMSQAEESSTFDIRTIFTLIILNWQWFLLSMFIFVCGAFLYLRYAAPTYQMSVKMLIKEEQNNRRSGNQMLANMQDLGFITNSAGIDNEIEILKSKRLALEAVKDLKLYVEYYTKGRVKEQLIYNSQPLNVDLDPESLEKLEGNKKAKSIRIKVTKEDNAYHLISKDKEVPFEATFKSLPATVKTSLGSITFTINPMCIEGMKNGQSFSAHIFSPNAVAAA